MEDKIKLEETVYDDMRSGENLKVYVNDVLIKSKYLMTVTTEEFKKLITSKDFKNKLEDEVIIKFKFGILEQEVRVVGYLRIIEAEGWK